VRVQLIRVHEDGTCARWQSNPDDLRLILVIPAKPRMVRSGSAS